MIIKYANTDLSSKKYFMFNESVKIKVPIYVLKYLTNLHSKDFQNYRSPEGSLLYVNEADQIPSAR